MKVCWLLGLPPSGSAGAPGRDLGGENSWGGGGGGGADHNHGIFPVHHGRWSPAGFLVTCALSSLGAACSPSTPSADAPPRLDGLVQRPFVSAHRIPVVLQEGTTSRRRRSGARGGVGGRA